MTNILAILLILFLEAIILVALLAVKTGWCRVSFGRAGRGLSSEVEIEQLAARLDDLHGSLMERRERCGEPGNPPSGGAPTPPLAQAFNQALETVRRTGSDLVGRRTVTNDACLALIETCQCLVEAAKAMDRNSNDAPAEHRTTDGAIGDGSAPRTDASAETPPPLASGTAIPAGRG